MLDFADRFVGVLVVTRNYLRKLSGWGRLNAVSTKTYRPEYPDDIRSIVTTDVDTYIAYGCGRSYGDEALNPKGNTILTTRMDRLLSFNSEDAQLVCEGGVTLQVIQQIFLPKGYVLVTSPGTSYVTVGGAIANDVHGKNHDRVGSFGNHVLWIDLQLASGDIVRCSRELNTNYFFATIGGMGLTGIVLRACLQLQKHPMAVLVSNEEMADLGACLTRLRAIRDTATYSVGWLNLAAKDSRYGSGILSIGEPAQSKIDSCDIKQHRIPSIVFPALLNRYSIRLYNQWHHYSEMKKAHRMESLMHFLYPLDAIANWNVLYGKRGFYQFQCVIPELSAIAGIMELCEAVKKSEFVPYLAVIKTLGSEGVGLMSFATRGFTLALDFPNQTGILNLLSTLESITLSHQGRVYLAKDACLNRESFIKMYPKLPRFREVLNELDPYQRWQSSLSTRLNIRGIDG